MSIRYDVLNRKDARLICAIPDDLKEKIRKTSYKKGITISVFVREILEKHFRGVKDREQKNAT